MLEMNEKLVGFLNENSISTDDVFVVLSDDEKFFQSELSNKIFLDEKKAETAIDMIADSEAKKHQEVTSLTDFFVMLMMFEYEDEDDEDDDEN